MDFCKIHNMYKTLVFSIFKKLCYCLFSNSITFLSSRKNSPFRHQGQPLILSPASGNHASTYGLYGFDQSGHFRKVYHMIPGHLCLAPFTQHKNFEVSYVVVYQNFLFLQLLLMQCHCTYVSESPLAPGSQDSGHMILSSLHGKDSDFKSDNSTNSIGRPGPAILYSPNSFKLVYVHLINLINPSSKSYFTSLLTLLCSKLNFWAFGWFRSLNDCLWLRF